jgi:hypothetical protein
MLKNPIRAAERYIDFILTTPVEPDARDRLIQHMSSRQLDAAPNIELARQTPFASCRSQRRKRIAEALRPSTLPPLPPLGFGFALGFYPFSWRDMAGLTALIEIAINDLRRADCLEMLKTQVSSRPREGLRSLSKRPSQDS